MNPLAGKLSVWRGEQSACVRIIGRANFILSVPFRRLLQHLCAGGPVQLWVDLSGCTFMDSTFLGVLTYEANRMAVRGSAGTEAMLGLLNTRPDIREIIQDLGVAHLVRFAERDLSQTQFDDVSEGSKSSVVDLNRTCLEAHELLMALNPENVEKFRDVARFFAEELKNGPSKPPSKGDRPNPVS